MYDANDPYAPGANADPSQQTAWWEQPAPPGYPATLPWPPPLGPGDSYGAIPGQVIKGPNAPGPTPGTTFDPSTGGFGPPTATPGPTPAPTPVTGGGGGGGGSNFLNPYGQTFQAPALTPYPTQPTFSAPTGDQVLNDPGYAFGLQQGEQALQGSAAAGGLLHTGGTLKGVNAWGQNYATQRYNDVFNRARNVYDAAFQGWQTNMGATQRDNETNWMHSYDAFLQNYNQWRDQRDSTFNKKFQVAQL